MRDFTKSEAELKEERNNNSAYYKQLQEIKKQSKDCEYIYWLNVAITIFKLNPQSLLINPIERFRIKDRHLFFTLTNESGKDIEPKDMLDLLKREGADVPNTKKMRELKLPKEERKFIRKFPYSFYRALYRFIRQHEMQSQYYSAVKQYEITGASIRYNVINGNLYLVMAKNELMLATPKTIDIYTVTKGYPQINDDEKARIFKNLKAAKELEQGSPFKPYLPKEQSYYLVDYDGRRYEYNKGEFSSYKMRYDKETEQVYKHIPVPVKFHDSAMFAQMIDFIMSLVGGRLEDIKNLAKMIAKIEMTRNPEGYITVIKYPTENEKRCFERFIYEIYGVEAKNLSRLLSTGNARMLAFEQEDGWNVVTEKTNIIREAIMPSTHEYKSFYELDGEYIELENNVGKNILSRYIKDEDDEQELDFSNILDGSYGDTYIAKYLKRKPGNKIFLTSKVNTLSDEKRKSIKKLVHTERITIDKQTKIKYTAPVVSMTARDPYSKTLSFVNRQHIAYMTDKSEEIEKLSKLCNVKVIELATVHEDVYIDFCGSQNPNFSYTDGIFLRTVFALFGVKLLADDESSESKSDIVPVLDIDKIISSFIDSVCILDKDAVTYMSELYETYIACYEKLHTGKPIMRKTMVDKLTQKPYSLKYYRPHFKGKPNEYAMKGISINESKLELIRQTDLTSSDNDWNDSYNFLEQELKPIFDFLEQST